VPFTVFIGDSVTNLWDQPNFGQSFWRANWNDQGVSGQNSSQILSRLEDDVVSQHPAVVHILIGTNDVYSTDSPPWQVDGGSPIYDTTDNIKAMVAEAQAAGIKVVLGTIPPWGCSDTVTCKLPLEVDPSPAAHWENIDTLNQWILSYGVAQGIAVVDYHSALVVQEGAGAGEQYQLQYAYDGVHPNQAGFAVMTNLVETAIAQVVAVK
jgi:lysophospholipase L1-like esterase